MRKYTRLNDRGDRKHRRFKSISLSVIALLTGLLGFLIYFNYDYMVLRILIAENYIYTDSLDALYAEYTGGVEDIDYTRDFDALMIGAVTEKLRATAGDRYTYLYTPAQYTLYQEIVKAVAAEAEIIEKTPDTVYLRIPNVSEYTKDFIKDNADSLSAYDNIIIDLRSNSGGALDALYEISELFLDKGSIIGYEETRLSFLSKTIKAGSGRRFDFESVILLQNGETASAAEGFITSLRENLENVTVVGTQSFGKGIGQVTVPLPRGYAVKATVLLLKTPSGGSINKTGITPDILYEDEDGNVDIISFAVGLK